MMSGASSPGVRFLERWYAPAPALRAFVDSYRELVPRGEVRGPVAWRLLPEIGGNLILHVYRDGRAPRWRVVGARSVFAEIDRTGRARTLIAVLRPGVLRRAFGVDARELTDRSTGLEELWGDEAVAMREALAAAAGAGDVRECWRLLDHELERRWLQRPGPPPMLPAALERIERARGAQPIRGLAAELGVTGRRLRQVMVDHVGLTPKRVARITRVRRALRSAEAARELDWARLAAASGYCDQPHMVGEFGELLGEPPERFLARTNRE